MLPRDYSMFGLLGANTRDRGTPDGKPPVAELRGLPSNYDKTPLADGYTTEVGDGDDHSHSWVDLAEFREAVFRRERFGGVCEEWLAILDMLERLPGARFVFWFDN